MNIGVEKGALTKILRDDSPESFDRAKDYISESVERYKKELNNHCRTVIIQKRKAANKKQ